MSNSYGFGGDEIKEESSWRYPLLIFFSTLILCAIFLYHYVGPGVDEIQGASPKPTISEEQIVLTVGDTRFEVPANYTVYPRDRRGGERDSLTLYLLWPTMNGYTPARRNEFIDNEPDTRRIDIIVDAGTPVFTEEQRLETLYLPHTIDKAGTPADYGLIRFNFKSGGADTQTNGYSNLEMFVGEDADGETVILFCTVDDPEGVLPTDCWREMNLTDGTSVRYMFKKPYLPEWQKINAEILDFLYSAAGAA